MALQREIIKSVAVLGLAMMHYLKSPATFRQFHEDSYFIEPSESFLKKIKTMQQVRDDQCGEMVIPQPCYQGTESARSKEAGESSQIDCDKMKM